MGSITSEKADLVNYQHNYRAQAWNVKWRDYRPLSCGSLTWEIFKKDFLDRLFPRDKRETKVVEFTNLLQEGISVLEYSLKITKL